MPDFEMDSTAVVVAEPPVVDEEISPSPSAEETPKKRRFPLFHKIKRRYPRIYAFFSGLVLPLFSLIAFTMVCGYPLAYLESPLELEHNDYVLGQQMLLLLESSIYANITQQLPRICLSLYYHNSTAEEFLSNVTKFMKSQEKVRELALMLSEAMEEVQQEEIKMELSGEDEELYIEIFSNSTSDRIEVDENLLVNVTNITNSTYNSRVVVETNITVERVEFSTPLLQFGLPDPPEVEQAIINWTDVGIFVVDCGSSLARKSLAVYFLSLQDYYLY